MAMKFKSIISVLVSIALIVVSPLTANAAPDPNTQGGTDGVIYMTETTDNAIYVGDFKSTPTPKSVFWQEAGSAVNEVAVTQSRIAWTSILQNSTLLGKLYISNIGKTAGTITQVDVPGAPSITGLASDFFNEKFYFSTGSGDIYSVKSNGTELTKLINADSTVTKIAWGLWFDSYSSKLYWCDGDTQSSVGTLSMSTASGNTLSSPTVLDSNFLKRCDGLGIDPATQVLFAAAFQAQTTNGDDYWMSFNTNTSQKTSITIPGTSKRAPSSMFVSHATSKIYFTTEDNVYEVNYDGTGLRVLYTGTHTSNGFQNIAVYYGQTLDTINSVGGADTTKPTLLSGSLTPTALVGSTKVETYKANEIVTWAITGGKNASLFQIDANGVVTFKKAPTKTGTYYVEIQATDSSKNASDVIKITVKVAASLAKTGLNQTNGITALALIGAGFSLLMLSKRRKKSYA